MNITRKAYAKVNLYLDIVGILDNGYHAIESIMQQISLHDVIDISLNDSGKITIECDHSAVPCDERNIAYKAAKAYLDEVKSDMGVCITITKHIPVQAGLGGGSADCAAVLQGLNELFAFAVSAERLLTIGTTLGADVPFCLAGGTRACKGIGEVLSEKITVKPQFYVVVQPDFFCSTAQAYQKYDSQPILAVNQLDDFTDKLKDGNINGKLYNIFELLYQDNRISYIKNNLLKYGATDALMSGSGSAVYGVFDSEEKALVCLQNIDYPFKELARTVF